MAKGIKEEGEILVVDPAGRRHIVPAANRKNIEKMNQFAKGTKYKIYPYDPKNPDAVVVETETPFTDVVAKLATDNKAKADKIKQLEDELAAAKAAAAAKAVSSKNPVK